MKEFTSIYADDTAIIISANSIEDLKIKVTTIFKKINTYYKINNLILNIEKTQLLLVGSKQIFKWNTLNNIKIENSKFVTYLGIKIDNKLSLNHQARKLIQNINKHIPIFYKIKNSLTNKIKQILIYTYIISHIQYNAPFISTCNTSVLAEVEISYKRIIKILFNLRNTYSTTDLFIDTELPDLKSIINVSLFNFANSVFKKTLPKSTLTPILKNIPYKFNKNTRFQNNIPLYHTKNPSHNFIFQSFVIFNNSL